MGAVPDHDVRTAAAPSHILEAMAAARDRDLIASQYCSGFADIFDFAAPALVADAARFGSLIRGIISTHLRLMARWVTPSSRENAVRKSPGNCKLGGGGPRSHFGGRLDSQRAAAGRL